MYFRYKNLTVKRYILLSLVSFWAGVSLLWGQSVNDFSIRVETTPSSCLQNGQVKIIVAKKAGAPTYTYRALYDLLNSKNISVTNTHTFVDNDVIGNLPPGVYKTRVKIENTENGSSIELPSVSATITSTYRVPSLKLVVERKSLNNYRPNGSTEPKPTGIISATVQGGNPPYTLTIVDGPDASLKGKSFNLVANQALFFYEIRKGTYTIKVSDQCGELPHQTIVMTNVSRDLPQSLFSDIPFSSSLEMSRDMQKNHCGWTRLRYNSNNSSIPSADLLPYWRSGIDTLAKYYDYAWQTTTEKNKGTVRKYYSFFEQPPFQSPNHGSDKSTTSVYYKFQDGITFQEIALKDQYWPLFFLRVKGSNEEMQGAKPSHYGYTAADLFVEPKEIIEDNPCEPYTLEVSTHSFRLMCYPIIVKVATADKKEEQTLTLDEQGVKQFPQKLDRGKTYILTTTDARGDVRRMTLRPISYTSTGYPLKDYCLGLSKDLFYAYTARYVSENTAYGFSKDWRGHKILFKSAPEGFIPIEGAIKVGEEYTIPQEDIFSKVSSIYLFAPKSQLTKTFYYTNLPSGTYVFEITDICGKKHTIIKSNTFVPVPRYTADPTAFSPKREKSECGRIRIYPFANGYEGLLKKDGVSTEPFLKVTKLPSNITFKDVRTNVPADYVWSSNRIFSSKYPAQGLNNPAEIYLDFPEAEGNVEMQLLTGSSYDNYRVDKGVIDNLVCMPTVEFSLQNLPLTYDRDTYIGYSCPSGTSGEIHITPINNVGDATVDLYEMDGTHLGKQTVRKGAVAKFNLKGTLEKRIATQYRAIIKDLQCQNTSDEVLIVYSLSSPSVIRSKGQQRKFCEGERIELEIVNLGDLVYQWRLPDGSTVNGRSLVVDNATFAHSGTYTMSIGAVVCDGHQTTVEIPFFVSVAPKELWWREDAVDADWHNPNNWALKSGTPISAVPAPCTDVHLPAYVIKAFPDLSGGVTSRELLGSPQCNDIYFHYGSQLGAPQELTYHKAYVDYNFGRMNSGTITAYEEPGHKKADSKLLARDRWYMVSTPLRNTVSGDFGLAGYPKTYQRYISEGTTASLTDISFNDPFPSLVESLNTAQYHGALALKVAGWQAGTVGYDDHKNLNTIEGIIRLPFFELPYKQGGYPLHSFDAITRKSTFRYYNEENLKPMALTDEFSRGSGIYPYRFVYETYNSTQPEASTIGTINVGGSIISGYTMPLGTLASNQYFMLGNPFMTPIDFDKLLQANSTLLHPYYYLFENNTWKVYSRETSLVSNHSKEIAPLQAVVLRIKNNSATSALLFPTSGENNVLLPPWRTAQGGTPINVRSHRQEEIASPSPILMVRVENAQKESSEVFLGWSPEGDTAPALTNKEYPSAPTLFIVEPSTRESSAICYPKRNVGVLDMGVHAELGGEMTLSFENIDRSLYEELILEDKETQQRQNLLQESTYRFMYKPSMANQRFRLLLRRYGVENEILPTEEEFSLQLRAHRGVLLLSTTHPLQTISLYDMSGEQVYSYNNMERGVLQHEISVEKLLNRVIVVEVRSVTGEREVRKLQL